MSQINLKAKKMEKTWKLYINCKFIGNKPEVKVNKLLKWWRKSISKKKEKMNNKWAIVTFVSLQIRWENLRKTIKNILLRK